MGNDMNPTDKEIRDHLQAHGALVTENGVAAVRGALERWGNAAPVAAQARPDARSVDEVVSGLYRKFKEWSKRGFGPDDVTWCEVRAAVMELMNVQGQQPVSGADGLPFAYMHVSRNKLTYPERLTQIQIASGQWFPLYRAAQPQPSGADGLPVELRGIAEEIAGGSGFWRSCSGCHELNEGHDTGPRSKVFGCALGNGCSECGGIGAIWDTTDYDAMGDALAASMAQPQPSGNATWTRLAAAMYQAAGAYDMPERVLDILSAAANGEPFAHLIDGILPIESPQPISGADVLPEGYIVHGKQSYLFVRTLTRPRFTHINGHDPVVCVTPVFSAQPQPSGNAKHVDDINVADIGQAVERKGEPSGNAGQLDAGAWLAAGHPYWQGFKPNADAEPVGLFTREQLKAALAAQASGQDRTVAGSIREPINGDGWRVHWWNESMRLMLPEGYRMDSVTTYRNGTMVITVKADAARKAKGGA